jgi:hypothetical protein
MNDTIYNMDHLDIIAGDSKFHLSFCMGECFLKDFLSEQHNYELQDGTLLHTSELSTTPRKHYIRF